ncbi:MAG: UDP-N-acetylmuramate dehydrogenase, partial [Patescibacteria group bacterium]|nr:UDP-N-acetylmuramate dehydrogenase [Patescibacteria group bacterium]
MFSGIKENILLKNYTTFKIGGPARYFIKLKSKKDLIKAVIFAKQRKLPFFVLGGGSNLLVSDKGFNGLIIKIQNSGIKIQNNFLEQKTIYVESGAKLSDLLNLTADKSLTGLEWAIGIPGTIGGAIAGNAGAFEKSIKDVVKKIEVFDTKKQEIRVLENKDCKFSYRDSIFKHKKNLIILSAEFQFKTGSKEKIKNKIKKYLNYRKNSQPINFFSSGSIFKNPKNVSAGKLIEECGLKSKKNGCAQISEKHANFIVNLGGAQANNVLELIKIIKKKVR